jgi:hypothetical protein
MYRNNNFVHEWQFCRKEKTKVEGIFMNSISETERQTLNMTGKQDLRQEKNKVNTGI